MENFYCCLSTCQLALQEYSTRINLLFLGKLMSHLCYLNPTLLYATSSWFMKHSVWFMKHSVKHYNIPDETYAPLKHLSKIYATLKYFFLIYATLKYFFKIYATLKHLRNITKITEFIVETSQKSICKITKCLGDGSSFLAQIQIRFGSSPRCRSSCIGDAGSRWARARARFLRGGGSWRGPMRSLGGSSPPSVRRQAQVSQLQLQRAGRGPATFVQTLNTREREREVIQRGGDPRIGWTQLRVD